MRKAAKKEFIVGSPNDQGSDKFTPRQATIDGVKCYLWTKYTLIGSCWVRQGGCYVHKGISENGVASTFTK